MVWGGVTFLRQDVLDKGEKVSAKYYIGKVLKPFLKKKKMFHAFFPGRENATVFHEDSASSHTTKMTIDFLNRIKGNYITPAEWMPKSPDPAPLDVGIWGHPETQATKRPLAHSHTMTPFDVSGKETFSKHFGKKEKMVVTSIFSFSHNVFYTIKDRKKYLYLFCFEFGQGQIFVVREWVKDELKNFE